MTNQKIEKFVTTGALCLHCYEENTTTEETYDWGTLEYRLVTTCQDCGAQEVVKDDLDADDRPEQDPEPEPPVTLTVPDRYHERQVAEISAELERLEAALAALPQDDDTLYLDRAEYDDLLAQEHSQWPEAPVEEPQDLNKLTSARYWDSLANDSEGKLVAVPEVHWARKGAEDYNHSHWAYVVEPDPSDIWGAAKTEQNQPVADEPEAVYGVDMDIEALVEPTAADIANAPNVCRTYSRLLGAKDWDLVSLTDVAEDLAGFMTCREMRKMVKDFGGYAPTRYRKAELAYALASELAYLANR